MTPLICFVPSTKAIAIKLFGAPLHSMADERTMSAVIMINTAQRNRQKVNVVIALTQVRAFYYVQKKLRVCTFSLTLSSLITAIYSFGKALTQTRHSNSLTSSDCFVPLIMTRAERRQDER